MNNSSTLKNELIFQYASGTANLAKSLMASAYLHLNSKDQIIHNQFTDYLGEELKNTTQIKPTKLNAENCMQDHLPHPSKIKQNPINFLISNLNDIKWKKIFTGFYEHSFNLSNTEKVKMIKIDPGFKIPLHSHNGKEFILVLKGSFCDEYGDYQKGNLQINDSMVKHTPIACPKEGCICLTIVEDDLVFYGPFAPILNIITLIKSFFISSK